MIEAAKSSGINSAEQYKYRFKLVQDNITAALTQIKKIHQVAEQHGYKEITDLLNEKSVPAGHDIK